MPFENVFRPKILLYSSSIDMHPFIMHETGIFRYFLFYGNNIYYMRPNYGILIFIIIIYLLYNYY